MGSHAAAGLYVKQHLGDFHLADIMKVAEAAAREHEQMGCRYADGWQGRLMAHLLQTMPDIVGDHLEAEETFCPNKVEAGGHTAAALTAPYTHL